MRGQVSLEFLVVIAIFLGSFVFVSKNVNEIKGTGDYALRLRNAQIILDDIYYSGQRVLISGGREEIEVNALTDYELSADNGLAMSFEGVDGSKTVSKELDFDYDIYVYVIKKGRSRLVVERDDQGVMLSNPYS